MQRKEKKQLPDLHVEVHALKCQVKKHLFTYISPLSESEPNN